MQRFIYKIFFFNHPTQGVEDQPGEQEGDGQLLDELIDELEVQVRKACTFL